MMGTVFVQFAIHFSSLVFLVDQAKYWAALANATTAADPPSSNMTTGASTSNGSLIASGPALQSNASDALVHVNVNVNVNVANVPGPAGNVSKNATGAASFFGSEPFKPNLLNSIVYLLAVLLQLITFAVNYKAYAFLCFCILCLPFCVHCKSLSLIETTCITEWDTGVLLGSPIYGVALGEPSSPLRLVDLELHLFAAPDAARAGVRAGRHLRTRCHSFRGLLLLHCYSTVTLLYSLILVFWFAYSLYSLVSLRSHG